MKSSAVQNRRPRQPQRSSQANSHSFASALASLILVPGIAYVSVGAMAAGLSLLSRRGVQSLSSVPPSLRVLVAAAPIAGAATLLIRGQMALWSRSAALDVTVWLLLQTALIAVLRDRWVARGVGGAATALAASSVLNVIVNFFFGVLTWKGGLGYAVAFCLVAAARGKRIPTCLALAAVSFLASVNDHRSLAAMAAVTLISTLTPRSFWSRVSLLKAAIVAPMLIALLIPLGTKVAAEGWLGEPIAERTRSQVDNGQNIILSARSEWAATASLVESSWYGFGLGATPGPEEEVPAIHAAGAVGGDIHSSYFTDVVFGTRVDLHAVAATMWFHFGVFGLSIAVICLFVLSRSLIFAVKDSEPFLVLLMLVGIWTMLFSPMADGMYAAVALAAGSALNARRYGAKESQWSD